MPDQALTYAAYKAAFAHLAKPFAYLDLDLLEHNRKFALQLAASKKIRIASKSIRSAGILRHLLDSDPTFIGLMTFTGEETLFLAEQGFDDLLLGYPIWNVDAITALARLVKDGRLITLMVDSEEHLAHIERMAQQADVQMPVCIDLDLSSDFGKLHFGVWRSPVRSVMAAVELAQRIAASPYLVLDGIMGYEAQIAGVGDHNPTTLVKNKIIRFMKKRSIAEFTHKRAELIHILHQKGIYPRFVNGGGSGSLTSTTLEDVVTEVTVGSGFYAPALFDNYQDVRFEPAAGYAIEIVRKPRADTYTCLGGGYTASGSCAPDKLPKVHLPQGAKLTNLEGAGEVQTPIVYQGDERLELGDPIFMRHSKAGELCERFTELHGYSQGKVVQVFPTYRGQGRCFL
ncbi:amino acid deaminase/aldolase [Paenibacillus sp. N1-5-1-14]|uniref:amino acid deaminase/aldolase n=1 Tax=Paenibacillus radicibacter TaxID=2972488 RepID=UPI00215991C7|nr:amino acid deaminase/aldolase [Paenibacillus radicibacter]MCR8644210.1 amino acid deaminase/aldolase [Paenibacillus radicibacter]